MSLDAGSEIAETPPGTCAGCQRPLEQGDSASETHGAARPVSESPASEGTFGKPQRGGVGPMHRVCRRLWDTWELRVPAGGAGALDAAAVEAVCAPVDRAARRVGRQVDRCIALSGAAPRPAAGAPEDLAHWVATCEATCEGLQQLLLVAMSAERSFLDCAGGSQFQAGIMSPLGHLSNVIAVIQSTISLADMALLQQHGSVLQSATHASLRHLADLLLRLEFSCGASSVVRGLVGQLDGVQRGGGSFDGASGGLVLVGGVESFSDRFAGDSVGIPEGEIAEGSADGSSERSVERSAEEEELQDAVVAAQAPESAAEATEEPERDLPPLPPPPDVVDEAAAPAKKKRQWWSLVRKQFARVVGAMDIRGRRRRQKEPQPPPTPPKPLQTESWAAPESLNDSNDFAVEAAAEQPAEPQSPLQPFSPPAVAVGIMSLDRPSPSPSPPPRSATKRLVVPPPRPRSARLGGRHSDDELHSSRPRAATEARKTTAHRRTMWFGDFHLFPSGHGARAADSGWADAGAARPVRVCASTILTTEAPPTLAETEESAKRAALPRTDSGIATDPSLGDLKAGAPLFGGTAESVESEPAEPLSLSFERECLEAFSRVQSVTMAFSRVPPAAFAEQLDTCRKQHIAAAAVSDAAASDVALGTAHAPLGAVDLEALAHVLETWCSVATVDDLVQDDSAYRVQLAASKQLHLANHPLPGDHAATERDCYFLHWLSHEAPLVQAVCETAVQIVRGGGTLG